MKLSLLLWLAIVPAACQKNKPDNRTVNAPIGHLASLRMMKMERIRFGAGHICAGSLIRVNAVLTAARCFLDRELFDGTFLPSTDFVVVLGTPNRFESSPNTMIFGLKYRVLMQDTFDLTLHQMDVAVVILNGSVPKQHAVVKPIQITDKPVKRAVICQMSGWGRDKSGYSSAVARSANIEIIGPRICLLKQTTQEFFVQPSMICGKHFGKLRRSYCAGDVGGSLVCGGQLAGIVSWGIICKNPFHPGIYTSPLYYAHWINDSVDHPTQLEEYFADIANHPMGSGSAPCRRLSCFYYYLIWSIKSYNIYWLSTAWI